MRQRAASPATGFFLGKRSTITVVNAPLRACSFPVTVVVCSAAVCRDTHTRTARACPADTTCHQRALCHSRANLFLRFFRCTRLWTGSTCASLPILFGIPSRRSRFIRTRSLATCSHVSFEYRRPVCILLIRLRSAAVDLSSLPYRNSAVRPIRVFSTRRPWLHPNSIGSSGHHSFQEGQVTFVFFNILFVFVYFYYVTML